MDSLKLYPSSEWYNSGVIAFLNLLDLVKEKEKYLKEKGFLGGIKGDYYTFIDGGGVEVDMDNLNKIFEALVKEDNDEDIKRSKTNVPGIPISILKSLYWKPKKEEKNSGSLTLNFLNRIKGKSSSNTNTNFLLAHDNVDKLPDYFKYFLLGLENLKIQKNCFFCDNGAYIDEEKLSERNMLNQDKIKLDQLLNRIKYYTPVHDGYMASTETEFPNAYRNMHNNIKVCHFCSFIFTLSDLGFSTLENRERIFINADSFRLMYELNKKIKKIFGEELSLNKKDLPKKKRELLTLGVISYLLKIQSILSTWEESNIEIVSIKGGKVNFYSLPKNIIKLINNEKVAGLLYSLGELSILKIVLDDDYEKLLRIAEKEINIALDETKGKSSKYKSIFFLEKNRSREGIEKILELYNTIKEIKGKEVTH